MVMTRCYNHSRFHFGHCANEEGAAEHANTYTLFAQILLDYHRRRWFNVVRPLRRVKECRELVDQSVWV